MKVDVLETLEGLRMSFQLLNSSVGAGACEGVKTLVAELIAADEEYDAARVAVWCDLGSKSVERYSRAQERRAAALLACKGQDHGR